MDAGRLRWQSAVLVASLGLLAVACGSSSSSGGSSSTASTPTPSASAAAALVKTASKTVAGKTETILVGDKNLTLYYFTPDKGGTVTCTGACAQNWPPLTLPSGVTAPTAEKSVTGKLATVANPAGGMQVTYNGWPLYYYYKDADESDTYGQGVGGKWFVATPDVAPPS